MPFTPVKQYPYGSRLRHKIYVTVDDNPSDPTTLAVYFIDPLGNETGPFTPTKDGTGRYEYVKTYTSTSPTAVQGLWTLFVRGTGAAEGSQVRQFQISSLNIVQSI